MATILPAPMENVHWGGDAMHGLFRHHSLRRHALGLLVTVTLIGVCSGCVRRRMTIRSDPPGALVFVDDQEIGTTPVSTSYIYYGTRKIRLVKDGYETLTVLENFPPPWYQIAPLDFVSENLWPWEKRDERIVDFELVPQRIVPTTELLGRAENLRLGSRQGYVAPLPATAQDAPGPGQLPIPRVPAGDAYNPDLAFPPPPPPRFP